MKKIFTLMALLTMGVGMNAQYLKLYKGTEVVKSYLPTEVDKVVLEEFVRVSNIGLSATTVTLYETETTQLTATVTPSNATLSGITWTSDNATVATVSDAGFVTALSAGTATITVSSTDGSGTSATCTVTVKAHEYVDLGLPSGRLWAKTNIGAENISDYGDTFAWGETESKSDFNQSNYKYYKSTTNKYVDDDGFDAEETIKGYTKYVTNSSEGYDGYYDEMSMLTASDDAATVKWGIGWCMPTKDDWQELKDNCTWEWKSINGVNGYKVTSKSNDSYIFLPSTGYNYWSCSLACYMSCSSGSYSVGSTDRYKGGNVRPVRLVKATGITLSATTLEVSGIALLTASITPEDVSKNFIEWTSSDESVAKVSNGLVVGVSEGTATITATAIDGSGVSASCDVTVTSVKYVDLGLSVKWATCNVGAEKLSDYGDYFAWGETTGYNSGKTNFSWSTYTLCNGSETTMAKYCTSSSYGTVDNKTVLEAADDAATANWGSDWRMPTQDECKELIDSCTWTKTQLNGVVGYMINSNKSGYTDRFIFLPATASCRGTVLRSGNTGYWSSSGKNGTALSIFMESTFDSHGTYSDPRYYGFAVRPVCSVSTSKITGVTLSSSAIEIKEDATTTLSATILPDNATNKALEWTSSNTDVATVDANGVVTGISEGTATITASATDGSGISATCDVTVKPLHEYVDLGLSVKWATCNVGASKPEEYGDYFAWGETTGYKSGKTNFSWSTYKWCNGSENTLTKYCTNPSYGTVDNKTVLDAEDDAATANWGSDWRMPTQTECQELINNCKWTWCVSNGVYGHKVTSTKPGYTDRFIFLPAAGYHSLTRSYDAGSIGGCWSGSLGSGGCYDAWEVYFASVGLITDDCRRYCGYSVRPVRTE